jgi:ABC-type transport system involved in multi-copper enzyme maturation permease subunit
VGLYAMQWAFSLALVAFAFLAVFLTRHVALGLVVVFFLPGLLEFVYTIYAFAVGFQPVNRLNVFFQTIRLRQTLEDLPRYFFTSNLYAPARSPVTDLAATFSSPGAGAGGTGGGANPADAFGSLLGAGITLPHAALVMAGYTVLFAAILVWRFLRHDVD